MWVDLDKPVVLAVSREEADEIAGKADKPIQCGYIVEGGDAYSGKAVVRILRYDPDIGKIVVLFEWITIPEKVVHA